jgi:hypothetical protein
LHAKFFFQKKVKFVKGGSIGNNREKEVSFNINKVVYKGKHNLFGGSVLGDSLGTFRDGVLGKFTRKDKTNSGLDLARRDGGTLVVGSQLGSFRGNTFKDIVDERVQDGHGLVGDTSIGMDLLQDLVDVRGVGLTTSDLSLLVIRRLGLSGLGGGFTSNSFFRSHFEI